MKITITYLPEEEREAKVAKAFVRAMCDGMRVKERDTNPPFKSIYLSTKRPRKKH